MSNNPQVAYLNSTLRTVAEPVTLSRVLVEHYSHLGNAERDQFVLALVMEIGVRTIHEAGREIETEVDAAFVDIRQGPRTGRGFRL